MELFYNDCSENNVWDPNNEGKSRKISDKGQVRGYVYKRPTSKNIIKRHA